MDRVIGEKEKRAERNGGREKETQKKRREKSVSLFTCRVTATNPIK